MRVFELTLSFIWLLIFSPPLETRDQEESNLRSKQTNNFSWDSSGDVGITKWEGIKNKQSRLTKTSYCWAETQIMNDIFYECIPYSVSFQRRNKIFDLYLRKQQYKGGTKRQVLRLNFAEIEFPKNLDWIASKPFDVSMKGFIETLKICTVLPFVFLKNPNLLLHCPKSQLRLSEQ